VRAIRNPNGVYVLTAAPLILVKMNGGLDPARELRPNFVVTSRDFVVLAARIPAILPAVIREHMREKSMLFIGHGMAEPDVREFARYAKKERGPRKSWAIQWPEKRDEAYWRASRGVEILKSDRDIYVLSLSRSLESRFGIKT
jgi:SIR2-like domain